MSLIPEALHPTRVQHPPAKPSLSHEPLPGYRPASQEVTETSEWEALENCYCQSLAVQKAIGSSQKSQPGKELPPLSLLTNMAIWHKRTLNTF